ncbi:amidohydrolase [Acinetobacter colistiniresistens]|uniref:amidohydrolase n=1 Tax=Acinetobacter colistiniresistens TaxID=280145 RepID=UPI00125041DC|nr:amidohydrolase [Acinetobacter colistiniresistens]
MKKKLLLCVGASLIAFSVNAQMPQADVIVINADIRTSNPAKPTAQAFAVKDGKFLAVGNNVFIQNLATSKTQIVDAQGKTVLPGLTDAHTHLLGGLELWEGVDLFGITDRQEWFKLIAKRDKELSKDAWLVGGRWDVSGMKDTRMPTRQELDAIVPDRPVVLQDIDYHTVWANTKAMQLLGIDKNTKAPEGGEIVKDPQTGEPTGIFKETAGTQLVLASPQYTKALLSGKAALPVVEQIVAHFNSLGITSVHDMWTELATVYPALLESQKQLPMRIRFGLMAGEDQATLAQLQGNAKQRDQLNQRFVQKEQQWQKGPQFRFGYMKYFVDGTLMSYTAALNEPYADRHHFNIEPITSQPKLNELVKNANDVGFPVAIHAIGDKSVDMALNAIEHSPKHRQLLNRIEHIEVTTKTAIPRFAQLGVVASMQPDHAIAGNYQESRLGEARMPYSYAWQSLLSSGASMVLGSDWPTAPENPMLQLSDVVFREYNGKTRYSDNALSLDEALYAYTQAPANVAGWGNELGSISVGKWADFVVLQGALQTPLNKDIKDWKVAQTWFAGQKVYDGKLNSK